MLIVLSVLLALTLDSCREDAQQRRLLEEARASLADEVAYNPRFYNKTTTSPSISVFSRTTARCRPAGALTGRMRFSTTASIQRRCATLPQHELRGSEAHGGRANAILADYDEFAAHAHTVFAGLGAASVATEDDVAKVIYGAATDGTDRMRYIATDDIRPQIKAHRKPPRNNTPHSCGPVSDSRPGERNAGPQMCAARRLSTDSNGQSPDSFGTCG